SCDNLSILCYSLIFFFFSSRRRHTRSKRDWSSDVCSSDLWVTQALTAVLESPSQAILHNIHVHAIWNKNHHIPSTDHRRIHNDRSEERRVGKECRYREWQWK